jgi:hypothetical protein
MPDRRHSLETNPFEGSNIVQLNHSLLTDTKVRSTSKKSPGQVVVQQASSR